MTTPDTQTDVSAEYRLDPGDLINVTGPAELVPSGGAVTAEVHEVLIDGGKVTYKVRILSTNAPMTAPVGSFHVIAHEHAQQQYLTHTASLADMFNDPRVIKYMDARTRGQLATVSTVHNTYHSSVKGVMVVTATVFKEIMKNRELGQPPLRPEKGERGKVTWMVATGDPAVGRPVEAKGKKTLEVRTFTGVPMKEIPVISTEDLNYRVQMAQRLRYADLVKEADDFLENEKKLFAQKKTSNRSEPSYLEPEEALTVAAAVREFAATHGDMLAMPNEATFRELKDGNASIQDALRHHLGSERPANQFIRFLTNEQAVQAIMWRLLGTYVASLPQQAAFIEFEESPLSQKHTGEYRDGSYLVVASRRFMYVLKADGVFI